MRLLELIRPFRLVVSRRVSEEEQVSVEVFCRTEAQALTRLDAVLSAVRDHRRRSNQEVVRATQQQLLAIETAIENRGQTLRELDADIERKRAKVHKLDSRIPLPGNGLDKSKD